MAHPFKKVLITGVEGFTGKYLSEYLIKMGFEVYGITTRIGSRVKNIYNVDLTNSNKVEETISFIKPNFVIHLAGISFVQHANNLDFYNVNVLGTENILKALARLDYDLDKVIIASSATVYGNQKESVLSEELNPSPANHYGNSKLAMEYVSRNYFDKFPIIITRPFNYTGVGQSLHFVIPKIVSHFKERKSEIELGNINTFREYNNVEWVVDIYYQLMNSPCDSRIVNICSGNLYSLKEVLQKLTLLSNLEIEVKVNQKFIRNNEIIHLCGSPNLLNTMVKSSVQNNIDFVLQKMFLN